MAKEIDDEILVDSYRLMLKTYCYDQNDCRNKCEIYGMCQDISNSLNSKMFGEFERWQKQDLEDAAKLIDGKIVVNNKYIVRPGTTISMSNKR